MNAVIGVDAHKKTHTLVAADGLGRELGHKTITTTSAAHREGVRWARARFGPDLVRAVEDCRSLSPRLENDLMAEGFGVIRVPPHLMSRTRASSRLRGKSDPNRCPGGGARCPARNQPTDGHLRPYLDGTAALGRSLRGPRRPTHRCDQQVARPGTSA